MATLDPATLIVPQRDVASLATPAAAFRRRLPALLARRAERDPAEIERRVSYYLKRTEPFEVGPDATAITRGLLKKKHNYHLDLYEYTRYFPSDVKLDFRFGDKTFVPERPSLVKARPVDGDNANSVLFKLNKARHFRFVSDPNAFRAKRDGLVWRGTGFSPPRRRFLAAHFGHPRCEVGDTGTDEDLVPYRKPPLTIDEQLAYKFILSIEGNDVATNLKWILSSRSLCFMPKPRFETWFQEGALVAGRHYVELADDYSDLDQKLDHYLSHPDEAEAILDRANAYVAPFLDDELEDLVALSVLERYFQLSGQIT